MSRLIDADELIGYMRPYCHEDDKLNPVDVILDIKAQPTVDAVPVRHGRWTAKDGLPTCSVCGSNHAVPFEYQWCPNCGAKMDGG